MTVFINELLLQQAHERALRLQLQAIEAARHCDLLRRADEMRQTGQVSMRLPARFEQGATTDGELLQYLGMDGHKWAVAFCDRTGFADVDVAIGWFCNAIMAGYDERQKSLVPPQVTLDKLAEIIRELEAMQHERLTR